MNKYYLLGAGCKGRIIIEALPYGIIEGVMDSDDNKIGEIFYSMPIQKMNISLLKEKNISVILSFEDNDFEKMLSQNNIKFYKTYGKNKDNIFKKEDIQCTVINNLVNRFNYDTRIKDELTYEEFTKFREIPFSEFNGKLIEIMKNGNTNDIELFLDDYYKKIEKEHGIYDDELFCNRIGFQLAVKIITMTPNYPQLKLLDIACGHGAFIKHLKGLGVSVEGIDGSSERVSYLKNQGLEVQLDNAEKINKCDELYDFITCFECLEHVVNPEKVVCEIHRLLKNNGTTIVSVPYRKRIDCDEHVRIFNENNFCYLFKDNFEIVNVLLIPCMFGDRINQIFLVARKKEAVI